MRRVGETCNKSSQLPIWPSAPLTGIQMILNQFFFSLKTKNKTAHETLKALTLNTDIHLGLMFA